MRRWLIVLALIAAAGAGAGAYGWRLQSRRAVVAACVPARPDFGNLPSQLVESVSAAESAARSWRHATAGLADLSRLYHANGFYPEALRCYEGLRALEPGNARWPHLQAGIVSDFGRLDEAVPLRRQAVALAPDYVPARLRLADVLLKSNRPGEAAPVYAEALRRDPGNPYALLGLARCDIAANNWAKARERLEAAIAQNPDFIGGLSLLVTVAGHEGDRTTAETLKERIGRREFTDLPDPWVDQLSDVCFDAYRLSVAGSIAMSAGRRDDAHALFDRAIALAPDASSYRRLAGQMRLNEQDFAVAKIHLEKAVALNPTDSDAWVYLVSALRRLGQEPAALNALLAGLSNCPQSPSLHLEYARWLKVAGRLDEAIAEFRYGYQLRPSEASPLVELAQVYFSAGRTPEALDALKLALERQPDHPMALATLTFYAISQRDEAAALQRWEQVRRQTKTPQEVVQGLRQAFVDQFGRPPP